MEAQINVLSKKQAPDLTIISTLNTQVKIMETEIKLLKIQIEEVKENNKNPLR
jgi:FtsZ-binding cell division protein ZapB